MREVGEDGEEFSNPKSARGNATTAAVSEPAIEDGELITIKDEEGTQVEVAGTEGAKLEMVVPEEPEVCPGPIEDTPQQ